MISVEGLKVEFNATPLFEDVSYVINKKDRIAIGWHSAAHCRHCCRSSRMYYRVFAPSDDTQ